MPGAGRHGELEWWRAQEQLLQYMAGTWAQGQQPQDTCRTRDPTLHMMTTATTSLVTSTYSSATDSPSSTSTHQAKCCGMYGLLPKPTTLVCIRRQIKVINMLENTKTCRPALPCSLASLHPPSVLLLTCFHEQVSCQPELLELAVQLTAPASKQEAPQTASTILEHPVDGSCSFTLHADRSRSTNAQSQLPGAGCWWWLASGPCITQRACCHSKQADVGASLSDAIA